MDRIKLEKIVDEINDELSIAHESWKVEVDAIRTCVNEIINDLEAENIDWKKIEVDQDKWYELLVDQYFDLPSYIDEYDYLRENKTKNFRSYFYNGHRTIPEIAREILFENCRKFLSPIEEELFKEDTSQDIEGEPKLIM